MKPVGFIATKFPQIHLPDIRGTFPLVFQDEIEL